MSKGAPFPLVRSLLQSYIHSPQNSKGEFSARSSRTKGAKTFLSSYYSLLEHTLPTARLIVVDMVYIVWCFDKSRSKK